MQLLPTPDSSLNDLQVIVIDSAYDTWDDPFVRELFSKLVALKLNGYRHNYRYGVLPVDTYDFVGTHHLVCRKEADGLRVIMGYKSVSMARCQTHRLPFPALAVARGSNAPLLARTLEAILAGSTDAFYFSSWTIDPEIRRDRPLVAALYGVLTSIHVSCFSGATRHPLLACGGLRLRTDKYLRSLGFSILKADGGAEIPSFQQASLIGDDAIMMRIYSGYAPEAVELAGKYRWLWDARQEIRAPAEEKAAA